MLLFDLIMIFLTGGFWIIVMIARNSNRARKKNIQVERYYKRQNRRRYYERL